MVGDCEESDGHSFFFADGDAGVGESCEVGAYGEDVAKVVLEGGHFVYV